MVSKVLIGLLALAAVASAACQLNETLQAAAKRKGRFMGTCIALSHLNSDGNYANLDKKHFDLITAENECKMDATEPQQGHFNFGSCDTLLNRAKQDGQTFRGHCLCWGQQVPGWVNGLQKAQKKAALQNHIKGVLNHYKGKGVYCWDVVNEAVNDGGSGGLKNTVWYPDVPDYIDVAFQTAHETDPDAKLFYNDYNADGVNAKSTYIYNMVKSMKQRGIPIHGVGLQMHLSVNGHPSLQDLKNNFKRFGDLGLEVHLTELDIAQNGNPQAQGEVYQIVTQACVQEPACKSIETWGIIDKYSWRSGDNPLLFDNSYNPKDAACGVHNGFL